MKPGWRERYQGGGGRPGKQPINPGCSQVRVSYSVDSTAHC